MASATPSPAAVPSSLGAEGHLYPAAAFWATMVYSDNWPSSQGVVYQVANVTRLTPELRLLRHWVFMAPGSQTKPLSHNMNLRSFRSLRQNIVHGCRVCVEPQQDRTGEREKDRQGGPCRVWLCWQSSGRRLLLTPCQKEQVLGIFCVLNDIPSSARPCQAAANAASCSSYFLLWPHNEPH